MITCREPELTQTSHIIEIKMKNEEMAVIQTPWQKMTDFWQNRTITIVQLS